MLKKLLASLLLISMSQIACASLITNGFTFSVASDTDQSTGTHFHSSTGGDFGNPAGKAEVGSYSSEEVRGLSEYDLTGLGLSTDAYFTFDVYTLAGLFAGTNDFSFKGMIDIYAYGGNNAEDISDYHAPSVAMIGSFSTAGIIAADIFSFNITSTFNDFINNGDSSLGIRLQLASGTNTGGGALTFENFRLTSDDLTTVTPDTPVPAPGVVSLLFGSVLLMLKRRK